MLAVCVACSGDASTESGSRGALTLLASAPASVEGWDSAGAHWTRSESHRYLLARMYDGGDTLQRFVLHERFRRLCCFEAEQEVQSEVELAVWPRTTSHDADPLWRAQLAADDGVLWDVFYRSIRYGCCDSSDALTFFHVKAGGPAYIATARHTPDGLELPSISVPNSALRRHIAFLDRFAPAELPEADGNDDVIGVLQYGPPHRAAERHVIRAAAQRGADYRLVDLWFSVPDQETRRAHEDLWSANGSTDPADLSGFAIQLVLYSDYSGTQAGLAIPVERDRLDLGRARLPAGMTVEPATPPAAARAEAATMSLHATPNADEAAVRAAVEALYARLITNRITGAPRATQLDELRPFLSDTLHTLLIAARALSEAEAQRYPEEKPIFVEGDLFSSLFEGPTSFRVLDMDAGAVRRSVRVEFAYAGADPAATWIDRVIVARDNGRWAVTDVEYGGDWEFASRGTLRDALEEALRG